MSKTIPFESKSGHKDTAEVSEPAGSGKAPAVVLIQEYWGINDNMKSITDRMAKEGFLAVTPDLYHGKSTKDAGEAAKMMQSLDHKQAMEDIASAVAFAKSHPRSNGKVAVLGFCMGGALSFAAAATVPGLSAVVPFYGLPDASKLDLSKITAPILGHFGKKDTYFTEDKAKGFVQALEKAGKSVEIHFYDAGHAFANEHRPEAYDAPSAKLAWERSLAFLRKHLG